jgi:hypothetical protein
MFNQSLARIMGPLFEEQYTFLIISPSIICRIEMFETKVVEELETHILCSVTFFEKMVPFLR